MEPVERALFVIEKTHEIGRMSGSILAQIPGWDRVKASRYLNKLAQLGWLEKLSTSGRPVYVLGHKVLHLVPDLKI
jgi:DNA-binding IclR family transcriptional regulator